MLAGAASVDRLLFPGNWPSANHLLPRLQRPLRVGDRIPDGPPGTAWFVVHKVEAPHLLVLRSTTHVPASWRTRLGASIDWVWTFALDDCEGGTRLLLRTRARTTPRWLAAAYVGALVPADFLMAGGMLRGIRRRAQHAQVVSLHPRPAVAAHLPGQGHPAGTGLRPAGASAHPSRWDFPADAALALEASEIRRRRTETSRLPSGPGWPHPRTNGPARHGRQP